jgi:hypothetical protein
MTRRDLYPEVQKTYRDFSMGAQGKIVLRQNPGRVDTVDVLVLWLQAEQP